MKMNLDGDGMGEIEVELPTDVADAIWDRLNTIATSKIFDGDPRTMDQRRADIYAAIIFGMDITKGVPDFGKISLDDPRLGTW
jgi:hypothetical protein